MRSTDTEYSSVFAPETSMNWSKVSNCLRVGPPPFRTPSKSTFLSEVLSVVAAVAAGVCGVSVISIASPPTSTANAWSISALESSKHCPLSNRSSPVSSVCLSFLELAVKLSRSLNSQAIIVASSLFEDPLAIHTLRDSRNKVMNFLLLDLSCRSSCAANPLQCEIVADLFFNSLSRLSKAAFKSQSCWKRYDRACVCEIRPPEAS
mmetsp:Transcript_18308/g.35967  ORF Transcript_18308/g.35967 Transcript_18308/m.35967 type:complete len:206 (-) Transcript_18308:2258-2875(-)